MTGGHPAHEEGMRIGGPKDPVAQSIRREQQADAMPTAEEVEREYRAYLSDEGCQVCGNDDPDVLEITRVPYALCRNDQQPEQPFDEMVFCDEHRRPSAVLKRARTVQQARNADADVVAVYDCGTTRHAAWEKPDPERLGVEWGVTDVDDFDDLRPETKARLTDPPRVDAFHVGRGCGATVDEVIRVD